MGIYIRYAFALLILLGGYQYAHSAERVKFNPTTQQIFSQTPYDLPYSTPNGAAALVGKETAYKLTLEGQINSALNANPRVTAAEYGKTSFPYGASAWTGEAPYQSKSFTVKPKVVVPRANILSGIKSGLKVSPAQLAGTLVLGGLLEGIGWVMDPANNTLQRPNPEPALAPLTSTYYKSASGTHGGYNSTGSFSTPQQLADDQVAGVTAVKGAYGPVTLTGIDLGSYPSGSSNNPYELRITFSYKNLPGSSSFTNDVIYAHRYGTCSPPYEFIASTGVCQDPSIEGHLPVTDADVDSELGPVVNGLAVEMIADLIRDTCSGSPSPNSCFQEMEDLSQRTIEGPSSVPGPSTTKTTNYTQSDGSPGVRTETTAATHNITYNSTSFDIKTDYTTTIIDNGVQVSQTTTQDTETPEDQPEEEPESIPTYSDTELPAVTPFYIPKYPDGLQGVWNNKSAEFQDSEFVEFMNSFVPDFSGSCPTWGMSFAIGSLANFGTISFTDLCYVFAFIKSCMLLGAVFLCRALIFGG